MAAVLDDDGHLALAAHADLAALMQDLFRDHLASDASPLAPDAALEQALGSLQLARREYLTELLLHREQRDILTDVRSLQSQIAAAGSSASGHRGDPLADGSAAASLLAAVPASTAADLERILAVAECTHTLNLSSDAMADESDIGRRRFGLSREDLFFAHFQFDEYQEKVLSIQQSVIPLLEERLKSRCEQLLHFFSSPPNAEPGPTVGAKAGATSGVSLLTAKAWQLPKLLSDATAQPQVAVSQAVEAERRTELAHFQQFQSLRDSLVTCVNALANDKMVAQAASDAILTDHWTARIDGIAHKLENLRIDLCGRTYTPHTLPALHEIRDTVARHEASVATELRQTRERVQQYRVLMGEAAAADTTGPAVSAHASAHFRALVARAADVAEQMETVAEQLRHARAP